MVQGVLIYHPFSGSQPKSIPFTQISWNSGAFGHVALPNGSTMLFQNDSVEQIIYFNDSYWAVLSQAPESQLFRTAILKDEVVLSGDQQNIVTDDDARPLDDSIVKIDQLDQQYADLTSFLSTVRQAIEDQVTKYKQGQKKVSGQWLSADEYQKFKVTRAIAELASSPQGADDPSQLADRFLDLCARG